MRLPYSLVIQFGEEYRPCKLARHVVGVKRHSDMNSFMFAKSLNARLFEVIQTYSVGKPVLIFDSTRKGRCTRSCFTASERPPPGVFSTAELLVKQYIELESSRAKVPWTRPSRCALSHFALPATLIYSLLHVQGGRIVSGQASGRYDVRSL